MIPQSPAYSELVRFGRGLRRSAVWIVLVTAAAALVGAALVDPAPPRFQSQSDLSIAGTGLSQVLDQPDNETSETNAIVSDLEAFINRSVEEYRDRDPSLSIELARSNDPRIVSIVVEASDAATAISTAQELADGAIAHEQTLMSGLYDDVRTALEQRIEDLGAAIERTRAAAGSDTSASVQALQERLQFVSLRLERLQLARTLAPAEPLAIQRAAAVAVPQSSPTSRVRAGGVAGVLGLLAGIGLAALRQQFDYRIHDEADLQRAIPALPSIVSLPRVSDPHFAEALWTTRALLDGIGVSSIVITAPLGNEGTTTLVAELGILWARAGKNVLLIDANLAFPGLSARFDIGEKTEGFADGVGRDRAVPVIAAEGARARLEVLPAGAAAHEDPAQLFSGERLGDLISAAGSKHDIVIFDSPPVLTSVEALDLARVAEAVVLVVRRGITDRREVEAALQSLGVAGAEVLAVVVTGGGRRRPIRPAVFNPPPPQPSDGTDRPVDAADPSDPADALPRISL